MDRKALELINYGMFVAGAGENGRLDGCIVNSFSQVTSGLSPRFTLTLNKNNVTYQTIRKKGSVAVSLLKRNVDAEVISLFGSQTGRLINKFEKAAYALDENKNPYLKDDSVAVMSLKVVQEVDLGTYQRFGPSSTNQKVSQEQDLGSYALFVVDLEDAKVLDAGAALTLKDYNQDGGLVPPSATIYRAPKVSKGFVCKICGYLYTGEDIPCDYVCPICGAPAEEFIRA